ncbi:HEAT repeat-containing protein 3, partial [Ophiophagus hannah]
MWLRCRNLSACGGFEVCNDMVTKDIMTPLVALLKECRAGLVGNNSSLKEDKQTEKNHTEDIANEAVNLLWNVCECNSTAVSIFNKEGCLDVVLQYLKRFHTNVDLAISVDPVQAASQKLGADISGSYDADLYHILFMASGVVWNIKSTVPSGSQAGTINAILKIFSDCLAVDAGEVVVQMKKAEMERLKTSVEGNRVNGGSSIHVDEDSMEEETGRVAQGEKDLLDLLPHGNQRTGIWLRDASDEEWEELSSSDESDAFLDNSYEEGGKLLSPLCLSAEIHTALVNQFIPKKVTSSSLSSDDKPLGFRKAGSIPQTCSFQLGRTRSSPLPLSLILPTPSANWTGYLISLPFNDWASCCFVFVGPWRSMTPEQLMSLCDTGIQSTNISVRINVVSILGIAGSVLAKVEGTTETLKMRKEGRGQYNTEQLCVLDNVKLNLRRFIAYQETLDRKKKVLE